jgi:predicted dehydrogenase
VAGDMFVHLFTGLHFITGSLGPTRIMSTGGLRFWKDGRDVPDVMLGLFDYPKTDKLPAFNLSLRLNFADGGDGGSGLRFIGSEGMLSVDNDVTLARNPRPRDPGLSIESYPKVMQDEFRKEQREKYPESGEEMRPSSAEVWRAPREQDSTERHFRNFFASIRDKAPLIEDPTFGLRAAGPAVISNLSYFEGRPYAWDPVKMKATPVGC